MSVAGSTIDCGLRASCLSAVGTLDQIRQVEETVDSHRVWCPAYLKIRNSFAEFLCVTKLSSEVK
jgi:hypothetical protein